MNINEIIGQTYTLASGSAFKIISAELYAPRKVSKRYKWILEFEEEQLVAIAYRGTFIPNITLDKGVARLTAIEVNGETFKRPGVISAALGILDDKSSCGLTKVE